MSALMKTVADVAHKVAVLSILVVTAGISVEGVRGFMHHRSRRKAWEKANPFWEGDPYYVYNPNYMRFLKKSDDDIIMHRPHYQAAKELREVHGVALQPPFTPIATNLDSSRPDFSDQLSKLDEKYD